MSDRINGRLEENIEAKQRTWAIGKRLAPGIFFLALSLLFFHRILLPSAEQVMGGYDTRGLFYVLYNAMRTAIRAGRLPLWEPAIFNGFPLYADPQVNTFYPPAWLMVLLPTTIGISWYMVLHVWLAGLGMYAFVRFMGARRLPALLAGVVFAFGGLLAGRLWAGHTTLYALDAWTPWVLLALAWCVRREAPWTAVVAGFPLGLALLAGHLPSFLYLGLIWTAFVGYFLLTADNRRLLVVRQAGIMLAIGLGLAAIQLAPFVEFSLTSQRVASADYEFASAYSLPPAHLVTLLVPEFFGEPLRVGYWSVPTFEELTYYAGLLVVLSIVLGLARPRRLIWFYLLLMIFGLWLALGRYGVLYDLAYDLLPPFRIMRAPARAAFLYYFAGAALLAEVMTRWLEFREQADKERLDRLMRPTLIIAGVLGFSALAATGAVFMAVHPTETSGRLWHQIGGYSLALAVILIGGGLLWRYLRARPEDRTQRRLLAAGLLLVAIADMWFFAFKFSRLEPVSPDQVWVDGRQIIGETVERVLPWGLNIFSQNGAMQVGLHSVFGYDALEPAAQLELAGSVPDPRSSAYDVLGAAYVLAEVPLDQFTEGEAGLSLVAQEGQAWVYSRPRALPVARMVSGYEVIAEPTAAIERIHDPAFSAASTAILDREPGCTADLRDGAGGSVEILEQGPGSWRLATNSQEASLLVLAETAYPGWQVTVDGQPAEALLAYTTLRAVCVPAGEHLVEWQFVPRVVWLGAGLTGVALVLVAVGLVLVRRRPA